MNITNLYLTDKLANAHNMIYIGLAIAIIGIIFAVIIGLIGGDQERKIKDE